MDPGRARTFAETYEKHFVPAMTRPWATALLRHAALKPGERVLDLACGTGVVARLAATEVGTGGQVHALDPNPAMLAVARSLEPPPGAGIAWREGDAQALPYPDRAFDTVLCQHGLPFVPDPALAVREMRRVLDPGGRALVMVLQHLGRHPVFQAFMESVASDLGLPVAKVAVPFVLHDARALEALFTAAGFRRVEIRPETITARFPSGKAFIAMALMSGAAAIPAFAQLDEPEREALVEAVRADVKPVLDGFRHGEAVQFPMHAHLAVVSD